jgi:hypothetical protein
MDAAEPIVLTQVNVMLSNVQGAGGISALAYYAQGPQLHH